MDFTIPPADLTKTWGRGELTHVIKISQPGIEVLRITATGEVFVRGVPLAEASDADVRTALELLGKQYSRKPN